MHADCLALQMTALQTPQVKASAHANAGLTGVGQIVGMGDTGIDWLHCTFKDSSTPGPGAGPFLQEASTGYLYWVNAAHRKIVYYRQVVDNVDENGHGTHCAGSAVGSLQLPGTFQTAVGAVSLLMCVGYCHLVVPLQHV